MLLFSLPNWPYILWFAAFTLYHGNALSSKNHQRWLFFRHWNSHDLCEHLQMHVLLVGDSRSQNLPLWAKEGWINLPVAFATGLYDTSLSIVVLLAQGSQGANYETSVCDDYMLGVNYTVSDNYRLLRWLFGFDWQNAHTVESTVFFIFWHYRCSMRKFGFLRVHNKICIMKVLCFWSRKGSFHKDWPQSRWFRDGSSGEEGSLENQDRPWM